MKSQVQPPVLHITNRHPGTATHAWNHRPLEVGAEWQIRSSGQPWLHSELQDSQSYVERLRRKKKVIKKNLKGPIITNDGFCYISMGPHQLVCKLFFFFPPKRESFSAQPDALELDLQSRLASNSKRSTLGVHHRHTACFEVRPRYVAQASR